MIIPKDVLRVVLDGLMTNTLPKLEKSLLEKLVEGFYRYFPDYEVITTKAYRCFYCSSSP